MGLAELVELMAHFRDDGLAHVPRQPHCNEGGLGRSAALELSLAPRERANPRIRALFRGFLR
jgi:hypothetical protein